MSVSEKTTKATKANQTGKTKAGVNGAKRTPERTFALNGRDLDFLDELVSDHGVHDVDNPTGSDLAVYVHNMGDADDRAEMLILLLPIARRVHLRGMTGYRRTWDGMAWH